MNMDFQKIQTTLEQIDGDGWSRYDNMRKYLKSEGIDIVYIATINLGRCYYRYDYEVRSSEEIPDEFIRFLCKHNVFGGGQEQNWGTSFDREGMKIRLVSVCVDSSD
jgi:hypothetical protein